MVESVKQRKKKRKGKTKWKTIQVVFCDQKKSEGVNRSFFLSLFSKSFFFVCVMSHLFRCLVALALLACMSTAQTCAERHPVVLIPGILGTVLHAFVFSLSLPFSTEQSLFPLHSQLPGSSDA